GRRRTGERAASFARAGRHRHVRGLPPRHRGEAADPGSRRAPAAARTREVHDGARPRAAAGRRPLASGGRGVLAVRCRGEFTPTDGRHLLYLLSLIPDRGKLGRYLGSRPVVLMHKAGWISSARHDAGLVYYPGGVFVAAVMTW